MSHFASLKIRFASLSCKTANELALCLIVRDEGSIKLSPSKDYLILFQNSLTEIYASRNQPLKMAFIIVTKKINTRIFYGTSNPPPGTIIDDVITDPLK